MRNLARMPAVYVVDDSSPNAFATGRDPAHAALAVTTGLVDLLDQRELRGVLAHEFAHIRHRDILLTTVAATIAGAISALAHVFHFGALFGRHDEGEQGGVLGALALVIVALLAATLIQLAVSRAREYAADATELYYAVANGALAQTLGRSLSTSLTVLLTLVALLLFGGASMDGCGAVARPRPAFLLRCR